MNKNKINWWLIIAIIFGVLIYLAGVTVFMLEGGTFGFVSTIVFTLVVIPSMIKGYDKLKKDNE